VLMCFAVGVVHAEVIAPDALIKNTVQEVIAIIKVDKDIQSGDQKKIIALVDAKVLPNFDFSRMTQLAVGKYWRTATPEQKQSLVTEFRNMLVRTYTKVFTVYRDQTVEVKPSKIATDDTEVTVKTVISKPGSQPILVDYEMKKADNGWKVYDISIDGVSMVMSYRGTFATQIQESGIDGLIKTLSVKNVNAADVTLRKEVGK
jgi:phospholipid transport system substrate-binding protein